jgi:hypothetical protein
LPHHCHVSPRDVGNELPSQALPQNFVKMYHSEWQLVNCITYSTTTTHEDALLFQLFVILLAAQFLLQAVSAAIVSN